MVIVRLPATCYTSWNMFPELMTLNTRWTVTDLLIKRKKADGNEGFYNKNLNFTRVSLNPPYSFLILALGVISSESMLMMVAGELWGHSLITAAGSQAPMTTVD